MKNQKPARSKRVRHALPSHFYPNVVYEFDYKSRPWKTIHVKAQARGFIVIGKNFMSGAKRYFHLDRITNVKPYKVTLSK